MFWHILEAVADTAAITARYEALKPILDERTRRLVAAAESRAIGKGGISSDSKATGISRPVIRQGIAELRDPASRGSGPHPPAGRRAEEGDGQGCLVEVRSATPAGIDYARRSGSASAMDVARASGS